MELDELYQELLLDHFKHPRGKIAVTSPTCNCAMHNPLCGDNVEVFARVKDSKIEEIGFQGSGCSISQASASMMTEVCKGITVEKAKELSSLFHQMMKEDLSEEKRVPLGDAASLSGVRKFAARIRCALLGWEALDRCLKVSGQPLA